MSIDKSDTCATVHFDTVSEDEGRLRNEVRLCDPRDTPVTHEDSRKVLRKLAANYEAGGPCQETVGFYLRRAVERHNAGLAIE